MGGPAARKLCGWETCGAAAMAAGVTGGTGLESDPECAWDGSLMTRAAGDPVAQGPKGAGRGAGLGWAAARAAGGSYLSLFFFPLACCASFAGPSVALPADEDG